MKLLVPYVHEVDPVDGRLAALAAQLGIASEEVRLPRLTDSGNGCFERIAPSGEWCFVVNPRVLKEWASENQLPPESLAAALCHFPKLLVYSPRPDPFDSELIGHLSAGELRAVQPAAETAGYDVAPGNLEICGAFTGLAVVRPASLSEVVFSPGSASPGRRDLVSLGKLPFLTIVKREGAEILFLGCQDIVDLSATVADSYLSPYFSRLAVPAIALRHVFAVESWRPANQSACVIVDDPLLRNSYGFLSFKTLLSLMDSFRFHTAIAFIPHNWRRNSAAIVRMFRDRTDRLSLCFHGNDHTEGEFAIENPALLDVIVGTADRRMRAHGSSTGIACDRIMVFPQGKFSTPAMAVLKNYGFEAAVNTTFHPVQDQPRIRILDLIQPAVLRYADFPLFLRDCSARTHSDEIAFKLFFGRPVLIVEHHDIFRDPAALLAAVDRINAMVPQVNWVSPGEAVRRAYLWRKTGDGTCCVRSYASTVHLSNSSASRVNFRIEWAHLGDGTRRDMSAQDEAPVPTGVSNIGLDGGASTIVSIGRTSEAKVGRLGMRRTVHGFVRRRLSEFRDNYLSRHPLLLDVAVTFQRRLKRSTI